MRKALEILSSRLTRSATVRSFNSCVTRGKGQDVGLLATFVKFESLLIHFYFSFELVQEGSPG